MQAFVFLSGQLYLLQEVTANIRQFVLEAWELEQTVSYQGGASLFISSCDETDVIPFESSS